MSSFFSFLLSLTIFLFLFNLPISIFCQDVDYRYSNCSQNFDCGSLKNIDYPFWGGTRAAEYCGHPSFQLECIQGKPMIHIMSKTYRVWSIDQSNQLLKISRTDTWDGNCPNQTINGNATFDYGLFTYPHPSTQNLTLFYDCPALVSTVSSVPNQVTCTIDGKDEELSILEGLPLELEVQYPQLWGCSGVTIIGPVFGTNATSFNASETTVEQVVAAGFELKYMIDAVFCGDCEGSGGHCGYNRTTFALTCFCTDGPTGSTCGGKGGDSGKIIGIVTGTVLGVVLLACILFFVYRRRKKLQSKSSALISRSVTPDSSLKPDLEKGSSYFQTPIFTYNELQEATNNFDSSKEIGDGGFGTVYYGKLKDGRVVAVKRLYENNYKRVEQFMNEITILSRLRHQNLVTLYGCTSRHSRELLLVYEYVPNGTVADHLHGERAATSPLPWPVRMSIAIETADAIAYLHASDTIHRDVKTNNILLDNNFQVKVADFGLSRLFPTDVTHVSTAPQGTPGYVDPEYYQCYQLNDKSDVYSFGVVLIEIISSKPAVDIGRHRHEINLSNMAINKIQNDALHELVDPSLGFETDYTLRRMVTMVAELAFRCLQQEKDMRPSMSEVLQSLREIKSEEFKGEKEDEVDNRADARLLKNIPPFSPTSVTDKWVSNATTPNTSG